MRRTESLLALCLVLSTLTVSPIGKADGATVQTDLVVMNAWSTLDGPDPYGYAYVNETQILHAEYGIGAPGFQPIDVPNYTAVLSVDGVVVGRFMHPHRTQGGNDGDSVTWVPTTTKTHVFRVDLDVDDNVTETDETNNVLVTSVFAFPHVDVNATILDVAPGGGPGDIAAIATTIRVCNSLADASPALLDVALWQREALGAEGVFASQRVSLALPAGGCIDRAVSFQDVYGAGAFEVRAEARPGLAWEYPFEEPNPADDTDAAHAYRLVDAPGELVSLG